MFSSSIAKVLVFILSAFVHGAHNLDYSYLEAMNFACRERNSCEGYIGDQHYLDRNCECDFACSTYNDCCVNALTRRPSGRTAPSRSRMTCVHIGDQLNSGVYAVSTCSSNWRGHLEIRRKCEGSRNLSDPMVAAPVIHVAQALVYKNRYCAECNNAQMQSLETFGIRLGCDENLNELSEEQIFADIAYDRQTDSWGVYRLNSYRDTPTFYPCEVIFDVPPRLNSSVRFCRSNLISRCVSNWARPQVRRFCEEYMSVVYDTEEAYRNPHCALCNNVSLDQISCSKDLTGRKRPMSFALLLDVNQSDGDQVGMRRVPTPECPSGHKYDPFFKRCRQLVCALPGHVIVDGRCVRG